MAPERMGTKRAYQIYKTVNQSFCRRDVAEGRGVDPFSAERSRFRNSDSIRRVKDVVGAAFEGVYIDVATKGIDPFLLSEKLEREKDVLEYVESSSRDDDSFERGSQDNCVARAREVAEGVRQALLILNKADRPFLGALLRARIKFNRWMNEVVFGGCEFSQIWGLRFPKFRRSDTLHGVKRFMLEMADTLGQEGILLKEVIEADFDNISLLAGIDMSHDSARSLDDFRATGPMIGDQVRLDGDTRFVIYSVVDGFVKFSDVFEIAVSNMVPAQLRDGDSPYWRVIRSRDPKWNSERKRFQYV